MPVIPVSSPQVTSYRRLAQRSVMALQARSCIGAFADDCDDPTD